MSKRSTRELFAEGLRRVNVKALMEAEEEYGDDFERELADLEAQGFTMRGAPFADRASTLRLHAFALSIVRKFGVPKRAVADAAQAVLLAAFLRRARYAPDQATVDGWLTGIARRIVANERRTRRRRPETPADPHALATGPDDAPSPEDAAERAELVKLCAAAVSPDDWRVLLAFAVEGMTIAALAEQEGVSHGVMAWRLIAIRRELRAAIQALHARDRDADVSHHAAACPCWRCSSRRGEHVGAIEFRPRTVDPTACTHPDDTRDPVSGDGWICGLCGSDVDAPDPATEPDFRAALLTA